MDEENFEKRKQISMAIMKKKYFVVLIKLNNKNNENNKYCYYSWANFSLLRK